MRYFMHFIIARCYKNNFLMAKKHAKFNFRVLRGSNISLLFNTLINGRPIQKELPMALIFKGPSSYDLPLFTPWLYSCPGKGFPYTMCNATVYKVANQNTMCNVRHVITCYVTWWDMCDQALAFVYSQMSFRNFPIFHGWLVVGYSTCFEWLIVHSCLISL